MTSTKQLKKITVPSKKNYKCFDFPYGLLGFEEQKQFYAVKHMQSDLFFFLQSSIDKNVSFILTRGEFFFAKLVKKKSYNLKKNEELFHIVTISEDREFSINLLGPLLIDTKKYTGIQIVSENKKHKTKHFLTKKQIKTVEKKGKNAVQCFDANHLVVIDD